MPTKRDCKLCSCLSAANPIRPSYPSWEGHPSLKTSLDCLEDYNRWVSEVVMPIAFQWIEEHHDEVYACVPDRYKDDVGVVIAAAFEVVKQTQCYREEVALCEEITERRERDQLDTKRFNPLWTEVADAIQAEIKKIYHKHRNLLEEIKK